jgi:DsbC/DsbD-like thiol-disulfide interchange protein
VRLLVILLIAALGLPISTLSAAERTKVRLVLSADSARAGETVIAAVELKMPPLWHTYWRNSGDSGIPTKIAWQLPEGISAGEIQWPIPEKFVEEGLTTYVYHDSVMLLVPLKLSENLLDGAKKIRATVSWLECEKLCFPGEAEAEANARIGSESKPSSSAALIQTWQNKLPLAGPSLAVRARWDGSASAEARLLTIEWNATGKSESADFYPHSNTEVEVAGETRNTGSRAGKIILQKQVKRTGDRWPTELKGIVVEKSASSPDLKGYEVKLRVENASR